MVERKKMNIIKISEQGAGLERVKIGRGEWLKTVASRGGGAFYFEAGAHKGDIL